MGQAPEDPSTGIDTGAFQTTASPGTEMQPTSIHLPAHENGSPGVHMASEVAAAPSGAALPAHQDPEDRTIATEGQSVTRHEFLQNITCVLPLVQQVSARVPRP